MTPQQKLWGKKLLKDLDDRTKLIKSQPAPGSQLMLQGRAGMVVTTFQREVHVLVGDRVMIVKDFQAISQLLSDVGVSFVSARSQTLQQRHEAPLGFFWDDTPYGPSGQTNFRVFKNRSTS